MVSTIYYLVFLLLLRKCTLIQINRSAIDTIQTTGLNTCQNISARYSPTSGMCVCDGTTTTFMSSNNSLAGCRKPTDLNCSDAFLVRINITVTELKIVPELQSNCSRHPKVSMWHLIDGNKGVWLESATAEDVFKMGSDSVLRIDRSNFTNLEGHLLILTFECDERCTIVKFQGSIRYPLDTFQLNKTQIPTNVTHINTELTLVELVMIIGVPSLVGIILLSVCCCYRHKLPCNRQIWTKRDSTCSKAKMTMGFDNDMSHDPWSPWYDINKLVEMRRDYLRKPSGDSFYIPTLKGYTKEKSVRGKEENIYEMNMAYDSSSSRPPSRFSCAFAENPYKESAT